MAARERQEFRYRKEPFSFNADLTSKNVSKYCHLEDAEEAYMSQIFSTMHLSARSYHRLLKVARTIADIDNSEKITEIHLSEAIWYRMFDEQVNRKEHAFA